MLSDKVRTETYRDSVAKNVEAIQGKKVLDLGCGTGILSMFCARHGQAEQVVGVDMSSIAHQAMDIVMENNLADTITIVKVLAKKRRVRLNIYRCVNFVLFTNAIFSC